MLTKILSLLARLLDLIEFAVTSWRNEKLRQEGQDRLLEKLRNTNETVRKRAQEIDRDVHASDLDRLDQRMRKYRLPPSSSNDAD